jgi:transposase
MWGMAAKILMPNAENCTLEEIQLAADVAPNQKAFLRFYVLRILLLGKVSKPDLCEMFALKLNTLNEWIRRFNAQGLDGLIDQSRPGRPSKIPVLLTPELQDLIQRPAEVGVTHWTGKKFHGYLRETLELEVGYRTVVRWLHESNFRLKVPRPWPDRQDETLRQAFQNRLKVWLNDPEIELWYMDECGVEGDPRPRRRWAKKGEKITVTHNGDHLRMNVTGMICPRTGTFYGLEFSHNDTEVFQTFLDHANADVGRTRKRNLLIMDNASWHKSKSLKFGFFEPIYLPPYSPDFNPIERLWLIMKAEWFTDFIAKDRDQLIARLDLALNWLIARSQDNQTTAAIR